MIEAVLHPVKSVMGNFERCALDDAQTFGIYIRDTSHREYEIHVKDCMSIGEANATVNAINKAVLLVTPAKDMV